MCARAGGIQVAGRWVDRQVGHPILLFGPNQMIGQAYSPPTAAALNVLIAFGTSSNSKRRRKK